MTQLISFIHKEFLHIIRDFRTLIILFGIPAMQIMIFGYVVSTDIRDAKIAVLDQSRDSVSRELLLKIDASEFFEITDVLTTTSEVEPELKAGHVKAVLVIESEFAERLERDGEVFINILVDASEPNTGRMVATYAESIINSFNQQRAAATGMRITPEVQMYYNPAMENEFMFIPGLMTLILILICALMTSVTITREKEFGTMEVLLVSPLRPIQIIIGKVIPYIALAFVDVVIILLMARFIFGLPIQGSLVLLLLESLLYIALSLSLGILISTVSDTMQQAMFISLIGMLLPSVLLSGFIFPIENMPPFYFYLSRLLPPTWFIIILKNIMLKGTGLQYVWKETLILIAMTAALLALSAKKLKIRLE